MPRPTVAVFNKKNFLSNLTLLEKKASPFDFLVMVKANAYGHGIDCALSALFETPYALGVAFVEEGIYIRQKGFKNPIVVLEGPFDQQDVALAHEYSLTLVLHAAHHIPWIMKAHHSNIHVWIKANSGMGRLGFMPEEIPGIIKSLSNVPHVEIKGLVSHLAYGEEPDHPLTLTQKKVIDSLKTLKIPISWAASASVLHGATTGMARCGLAAYGVSGIETMRAKDFGLKSVMELRSALMAIHTFPEGHNIGYGARYTCPQTMSVGFVPIGYGDGYPFLKESSTPVWIEGQRCHVIGRVSMDMIAVDLRLCPQAQVMDRVVLWGEDLPIEEVSQKAHEIPYRLLAGLTQRVPRRLEE